MALRGHVNAIHDKLIGAVKKGTNNDAKTTFSETVY